MVEFDSEKHELIIARGTRKGSVIKPTTEQRMKIEGGERYSSDLAVVQRFYDVERKRTVIMSAGMGSNGTMAATLYLVRNWNKLFRKFGRHDKGNFAIVIECPNRRLAENGYQTPTTLGEFVG